MYFYDCELGYVPDNGQNDVTNGSVENYDFDWEETDVSDTTDTVDVADEQSVSQVNDQPALLTDKPV